jgi:hypothetical protein
MRKRAGLRNVVALERRHEIECALSRDARSPV